MTSLPVTISRRSKQSKTITIEVDAKRFEAIAGLFGFFGEDFLSSLDQAEKDFTAGRTRKIKSFKELRTK